MTDLAQVVEEIRARDRMGVKPGLVRTADLLRRLGDPQEDLPAALVGGTNGKGSVCAVAQQALTAAGHRVGSMPKPELTSITDRIRIDGTQIGDADFVKLYEEVNAAAEVADQASGDRITAFELMTCLGFLALRRAAVDVLVCEVGMGGALDSTNQLPAKVKAITNVAADHLDLIGPTLQDVAREKLGIVRADDLVVLGPWEPLLAGLAERQLDAVGVAARWRAGTEVTWAARPAGWDGWIVDVRTPAVELYDVVLPMLGNHQPANAAVAVAVLGLLERAYGLAVPPDLLRGAVSRAHFEGRMETWTVGGHRVVVDAAHNPAGVASLVQSLGALADAGVSAVVGAFADKDWRGMLDLVPVGWPVVAVDLPSPRSAEALELAAYLRERGVSVRTAPGPVEGLTAVLDVAAPGEVVVAFGSLSLVGALRDATRG